MKFPIKRARSVVGGSHGLFEYVLGGKSMWENRLEKKCLFRTEIDEELGIHVREGDS